MAEFMAERVGQTFSEPGTFLGPYPSGAPAIFADQVAKTGTSAAMVGWVGDDGFGDLILNRLRETAWRFWESTALADYPPEQRS